MSSKRGRRLQALGDYQPAEDAAQEAFAEAHTGSRRTRGQPAAFAAWFRTMVFKHCDRQTRRKRRLLLDWKPRWKWLRRTRQLDMIDELLGRGADLNARRPDGARPIQLTNGDYHYRGWRDVPQDWPTTPADVLAHLRTRGASVDICTAAGHGRFGTRASAAGSRPDACQPRFGIRYVLHWFRCAAEERCRREGTSKS